VLFHNRPQKPCYNSTFYHSLVFLVPQRSSTIRVKFVGLIVGWKPIGMKKLTALAVAKITKPGRYAVGEGAYLQVSERGRSWVFRYHRDGRGRHVGLGPASLVTLAEARDKARAFRKLLLDGIDPLANKAAIRQKARLDAAKAITFKDAAESYIAAHEQSWGSADHRKQWRLSLANYAYPILGGLSVAVIDTALVMKAIEPIWGSKPETASRVRNRIELILDWAAARGYREGPNPARWRGHLDKLLPKATKLKRIKHHPALPYAELPAFMEQIRQRHGVDARALEFLILTAARTGEVLGARWEEIDLQAAVWTVPPERIKGGREHRIPLSDRALTILRQLPREGELVFPGQRSGKPLYTGILQNVTLPSVTESDVTVHGFRSSFRDWCAEQTNYPRELAELSLAHSLGSKVEAAYQRGDMLEKRRRLMDDWAAYCAAPARTGDVVSLRRSVDHA
jgi:integrase